MGIPKSTDKLLNALWAKKASTDNGRFYLPLINHLEETAYTMNWLYNHWISDGVRAWVEADFPREDAQKVVKFLGFMHDCGKATANFQTIPSRRRDNELDTILEERLSSAGFKNVSRPILAKKSPHPLAGQALLELAGVPISVAAIVGAHHGRPLEENPDRIENISEYTSNYFQDERDADVQAPWKNVQAELLNLGLNFAGFTSVDEIPSVSTPQAILLEGLLVMADWLASTEYLDAKKLVKLVQRLKAAVQTLDMVCIVQSLDEINLEVAEVNYATLPTVEDELEMFQQVLNQDFTLTELKEQFNALEATLQANGYFDVVVKEPLFPLVALNDLRPVDSKARFKRAILNWNKTDNWIPESIEKLIDPYRQRWGFKARPFQKMMTEQIQHATSPSLVIIEAGMGSGKTETALLAAEQLAYKNQRDGVFIGLPTQATSDAMFTRAETWVKWLADRQHSNLSINLSHGKSAYNQIYQELQRASNIDAFDNTNEMNSGDEGTVSTNAWFTGKKSILTSFSIGTIDNLLLMGLNQRHLFLRHLGFCNKVIVIDEVHAIDSYTNCYLKLVLSWLGIYHVPVIMLSATLPKEKRSALIDAYLKCRGCEDSASSTTESGWRSATAYPLLTMVDGDEIKQATMATQHSGQIAQTISVTRLGVDDLNLIRHVVDLLSEGGVAGIIVNTVKRAQTLARIVAQVSDIEWMVLHSAFLAPDRTARETKLQRLIGKNGNRPTRMIVIGTQVLEQSLDIDFDVMYTDISPVDLILQRIGRLHRHLITFSKRERPKKLQVPQLFVLGINDQNDYGKANEKLYGKYLLRKTDYFLPNIIALPDDISPLVQKVYDSQTDQQISGIQALRQSFEDKMAKLEQEATAFQVELPEELPQSLLGWLSGSWSNTEAGSVQANAAVRDIEETLEVILVIRSDENYSLVDGRDVNQVSASELSRQVIRIPPRVTRYKIGPAITKLETITRKTFPEWRYDVWLKGALVLILDKNGEVNFLDWHLSYSQLTGLNCEKKEICDE